MENKKTILDETGVVDEKQKVQNIKTDEDNHPINIKLKELESALTFSTSLSPAEKKDLEQRVGSIIKDPAPVSEETIMNKLEEILQITTNRSFKKEQAVGVSNEKPKRKLTEEAEHLLEDYKRIPILNSKNFKKIAEENGIVLEQKDKPEDIIQKLINKRDEKEAVEEKVEEKTEIFAPKTQEMKKDEEKAIEKKEIGISFIELRAKRESLLESIFEKKRSPMNDSDRKELEQLEKEVKKTEEQITEKEKTKEEKTERLNEDKNNDTTQQFEKDFAFTKEELQTLEAKTETENGGEKTVKWSDLSEGQQFTLLQNLREFALDNAKEQALKKYTEKEKTNFENSGWVKRAWLGATKTYRRSSGLSKIERETILNAEENKEIHKEILEEMLKMAIDAPEMEIKDGKTKINFALAKDLAGMDLKSLGKENLIVDFNNSAHEFAQIPSEWAYSAIPEELEKYNQTKESYAKARGGFLAFKTEQTNEDDAVAYIVSLDKKIHFNQLFTTNPDVEKIFTETLNQKDWWEGIKATGTERGGLMMGGLVIRAGSMAGAAALAAGLGITLAGGGLIPVLISGAISGATSGGLIGGYMAKKRAEMEIADKKNLAEMGVLDENNKKDYRTISENGDINDVIRMESGVLQKNKIGEIGIGLLDKLNYAINRVKEAEDNGDEKKEASALSALGDRLYYTEQKLSEGLVNFGERKTALKNKYELELAFNTARILHQMNEPELKRKITIQISKLVENYLPTSQETKTTVEKTVDVKEKIDTLLKTKTVEINDRDTEQKKKKMINGLKNGALLGGIFGAGFSWIGYHHTHQGEDVAITSTAPKNITNTTNETATIPLEKITDTNEILPLGNSKVPSISDNLLNTPKVKNWDEALFSHTPVKNNIHSTENIPVINTPKIDNSVTETIKSSDISNQNKEFFTPDSTKMFQWEEIKASAEHFKAEIESSLQKLSEPYTVKSGDNIWNILKTRLGENEYFNKLTPRERNFVIDSLKDKITHLSKADLETMGIGRDPNLIHVGDKIDFSKIINNENTDLTRIFNHAHSDISQHFVSTLPPNHPLESPLPFDTTANQTLTPQIIEPINIQHPLEEITPTEITPHSPEISATIAQSISQEPLLSHNPSLSESLTIIPFGFLINRPDKNAGYTPDKYHDINSLAIPKRYRDWAIESIITPKNNFSHETKEEIKKELYEKNIESRQKTSGDKETLLLLQEIAKAYGITPPISLAEIHKNESFGEYIGREMWKNYETGKKNKYQILNPLYILKILKVKN